MTDQKAHQRPDDTILHQKEFEEIIGLSESRIRVFDVTFDDFVEKEETDQPWAFITMIPAYRWFRVFALLLIEEFDDTGGSDSVSWQITDVDDNVAFADYSGSNFETISEPESGGFLNNIFLFDPVNNIWSRINPNETQVWIHLTSPWNYDGTQGKLRIFLEY